MRSGLRWLVAALLTLSAAAAWGGAPPGRSQLQALLDDGKELYNQGNYTESLGKFREAMKLKDDNIVANHYMARLHALLKEFKPAIDYVRKLQRLGVSIYRSEDSKATLNTVMSGILGVEDLKQRGELLIHLRETIQGLPTDVERRIDAHLMGIYAQEGESQLHDVVKTRYFRVKPISAPVFFTAARTYIEYGVRYPEAASYFEQAIDALKAQEIPPSGNPQRDEYRRKLLAAETTVAEDFLAFTYHTAGFTTPEKNRFVAAERVPKVAFRDVTEAAGLKGVLGPRVAVGDYDGDGFEDLCVTGRVFKNEGGKTFKDVTEQTKIDRLNASSALWLDYDGDGHLDLLLGTFPTVRLWRNLGNGTFSDVTAKVGLNVQVPGIPEALAAADYDADGRLDLFIGTFEHPERPGVGLPDFLFRNTGTRFEDVTERAGLRVKVTVPDPKTGAETESDAYYCARGCMWGDFNDDAKPDLYVANYRLYPNQLFVNQGGGKFLEQAEALGVRGTPGEGKLASAFGHSIGPCWGDVNGDGLLDLAVTSLALPRVIHFSDTTALYINGGKEAKWRLADTAAKAGIRYEGMVADVAMVDFDNDGDLDLYFTAIYKERPTFLYQNDGKGSFQPVTWRAGALAFNTWGQAWFDKDNDGDLDVALGSAAGIRLLENQAKGTSSLRLRLAGKGGNRQGIGARVTATAGPLRMVREASCGGGSASQSSPIVHFGLAGFTGGVQLTIRWPDGHTQKLDYARPGRLLTIEEK